MEDQHITTTELEKKHQQLVAQANEVMRDPEQKPQNS